MFGFNHPSPPSRKAVATQVVRQESRSFDAHALTVEPPGGPVAAPPDDAAVLFSVSYGLGEYLGIVREQLARMTRRDGARARRAKWAWPLALAAGAASIGWTLGPGWPRAASLAAAGLALACLPAMTWLWLALLGTPLFYLKKRRMPVCAFRIDGTGIERTTRAGRLVRRWDEVRAVRRYRHGYLVMLERGAMPIPLRCLSGAQQARLRTLLAGRG